MKVITGAAQKRTKSGPFVERPMVQSVPTAYICRGTYCHPPVQTQQAYRLCWILNVASSSPRIA